MKLGTEVAVLAVMNNKLTTTLLGGLLSASLAAPALAGDFSTPIQTSVAAPSGDMLSFTAGYHSDYVWRGINLGSDLVDWSLEASTAAAGFDLTAGVWAARFNNGGEEIDFYASASKDLGFATVELGYIFYYFDNAASPDTQEVYLGLSKEVAGVDLSATYYYDFDQGDQGAQGYLELGAEKSFGCIDAGLAVGLDDDFGFTHAQVTLSKTIDLNGAVSLTPYVSYSYAIEDIDASGNVRDDDFIAGASLGFSF